MGEPLLNWVPCDKNVLELERGGGFTVLCVF